MATINKKGVFYWTLYDFANSITIIVFFLYFSQWMVIDKHIPDIWYNAVLTGSSILFLFTGPLMGILSDKIGVKLPFLRIITLLIFLGFLGTSLFALLNENKIFLITVAVLFFLLTQYFYQLSFIFYNAFLNDLAPQKLRGLISGIGQTGNWLGQIVGLLITLPIVGGALYLFGESGRAQTFLPATILFLLLTLPMLILFKESAMPKSIQWNLKNEYKNVIASFRELLKTPGLGLFLLAYFFFNDAMLTGVNNLPIYLEQVFSVTDKTKALLAMGILSTAVPGALFGGWIGDKIGLKRMLLIILMGWIVAFPIMAVLKSFAVFTVIAISLGFLFGATWAVARAIMSHLSPLEKLTESFNYYTLYERFATLVGPITWGLIVSFVFVHTGDLRYRIALITMTVFIVIGFLILRKVPDIPAHTSNE